MSKLIFSSDELPAELDDQARFNAWRDIYLGTICYFDVERLSDLPFSIRYEFLKIGEVGLSGCEGTTHRFIRTAHHLAANPCDDFFVTINGPRPWEVRYNDDTHEFAPGAVCLVSTTKPGRAEHAGGSSWSGVVLPRSRVEALVRHPDDLIGVAFDPQSEAVRYLKRYVGMLLAEGIGADPALTGHIETTLTDLIALILNGRRDAAEQARMRGLRGARLQAITAEISRGFSDPELSPRVIGQKLGLSANYVQKLLNEAGTTFTERVLELRLQQARAMLASRRNDHLKVSDIALSCGFGEMSYFHRCFRRRFGAAPNAFRGTGAH